MKVYHFGDKIDNSAYGSSCAMGNFDGIHLGHQNVIDLARQNAHGPLGVITFEPHPREFFSPQAAAFRLGNAQSRAHRLTKLGVEYLFELSFNAELASMSPEVFVKEILIDWLSISRVVVGADFCFGKGRLGTSQDLYVFGKKYGFECMITDLIATDDTIISSSAIRQTLSQGLPKEATKMLGVPHSIAGKVIDGDKRGRELGFPTANISLDGLFLPRLGIYAVKVDILTGPHKGHYQGVSSLGVRPSFGTNTPNLETYIFDFDKNIYGEEISVSLIDFLRPESKFSDIAKLISQMESDCELAIKALKQEK